MKLSAIRLIFLLAGLVTIVMGASQVKRVTTRDEQPAATADLAGNPHTTGDCLACHAKPGLTVYFSNGETLSVTFDPQQHTSTIHSGFGCAACHEQQRTYPHLNSSAGGCAFCHPGLPDSEPAGQGVFETTYQDQRALVLELNQSCQKCHADQSQAVTDSVHARIMSEGNRYAPVCADCHGSHDITPYNGSRSLIPQICSKCHLAEFSSYRSSVHGAALEEQSNPDVPTCGDCHGIHTVSGPSVASFRADSIEVCGKCHSNKAVMAKYNLSTDVLSTYLDDFHGRTVNFFRLSGESRVTKATCYDCHGIHNIRKPSDPLSKVYPDNLQKTCGQCHADANIRFPQAWLGHVTPTLDKSPVLYTVNQGYKLFIPIMIGLIAVYIAIDARRRLADWLKKLRKPASSKSVTHPGL